MADKTAIEWTDATWNPIRGCSRVSEGCRNCYAEGVAARFSGPGQPYDGLADRVRRLDGTSEARWTGKMMIAPEATLTQPLRWKKPRRIFVNSMSDLFHEGVRDETIDRIFAVMALSPQHTFQVLTKRPERMRDYMLGLNCDGARRLNIAADGGRLMEDGDNACDTIANGPWPLPNVWLGVSVEDQATADERMPHLLDTPAAVRFISAEPLLGPVDLTRITAGENEIDALRDLTWKELWDGCWSPEATGTSPDEALEDFLDWYILPGDKVPEGLAHPQLDWVIVGGESGPKARPMHPDWVRAIRDQCAAAGTAFFFKQWGEWAPVDDWRRALRGADMVAIRSNGALCDDYADEFEPDGQRFERAGKKRAGRLLDGVTHDALPQVLP